jgi:CheY-like chemotaxis protein
VSRNAGKLVLVVDDFREVRDICRLILERVGYRVATASDGEEAMDAAIKLLPDLILMDLSLPVINGWAATRKLKQDVRTRDIPVIILTAYMPEDAESVVREGCEGFLPKTTLTQTLVREADRVLESRNKSSGGATD